METRVAVLAIIVRDTASVPELNELLHQYAPYIIGRMGVPYHARGVNIISVAVDAPADAISSPVRQDRPAGGDHGQDRLRAGGCAATRKVRKQKMKQWMKKSLAACLALVMCLTLGRLWREGGRDARGGVRQRPGGGLEGTHRHGHGEADERLCSCGGSVGG